MLRDMEQLGVRKTVRKERIREDNSNMYLHRKLPRSARKICEENDGKMYFEFFNRAIENGFIGKIDNFSF